MRRLVTVTVLVAVAALAPAGCGPSTSGPTGSPTSVVGTPTTSARPTPAALPAALLEPLLDKAIMTTGALVPIGGPAKSKKDEIIGAGMELACGRHSAQSAFGTDQVARRRTWNGNGLLVYQDVHVLARPVAGQLMKEARDAIPACKSYRGATYTSVNSGKASVARYPGVAEVTGYCEKITYTRDTSVVYSCTVIMTHPSGHLIVEITSFDISRQQALTVATKAGTIAAKALTKVVIPAQSAQVDG